MSKKAFLTGITGQDGSYLAEQLLEKGYEVHGLVRASTTSSLERIQDLVTNVSLPIHLHQGNLSDSGRLTNLLRKIRPDEIYNLAAFSDGKGSEETPEYTAEINGMGPLRLLESLWQSGIPAGFFQASSAEIFGPASAFPQNELTTLNPSTPYGYAKAFAHRMVVFYRTTRKLRAVNGILYNHESPRRGETFVTRKITRGLARILAGKQDKLLLGNLDSKRDWGYAKDYVQAMWLMLQQVEPSDYIIATGESHSVREFLEEAFSYVGLDYRKYTKEEIGLKRKDEPFERLGDISKARKLLGWNPKLSFCHLVRLMVDEDLNSVGLSPPVKDKTREV